MAMPCANLFELAGVLSGMAGMVGVWAVIFESARAVKVYLLSWTANLFLDILTTLQLKRLMNKYHVQQGRGGTESLASAVQIVTSLYYTKVRMIRCTRRIRRTGVLQRSR